jgi:hypothetical protein
MFSVISMAKKMKIKSQYDIDSYVRIKNIILRDE